MRLCGNLSDAESDEIKAFSDWIIGVGEGTVGGSNDGVSIIDIPEDLVVRTEGDTIAAIVDNTYPDLKKNMSDASFLRKRAILAPTLEVVDLVNNYIVGLKESEEVSYLSSDTASV